MAEASGVLQHRALARTVLHRDWAHGFAPRWPKAAALTACLNAVSVVLFRTGVTARRAISAGSISWITSTGRTSVLLSVAGRVVAPVECATAIAAEGGGGGFSISGFGVVGRISAGRASVLDAGACESEAVVDAPRLMSSWIENGAGLICAFGVCFGSIVQSLSISKSNLG